MTPEIPSHRAGGVRRHIAETRLIREIIELSSASYGDVNIHAVLTLSVEEHHIVSLRHEIILMIHFMPVIAAQGIVDFRHAVPIKDKVTGIGMSMVPGVAALNRKHKSVLFIAVSEYRPTVFVIASGGFFRCPDLSLI